MNNATHSLKAKIPAGLGLLLISLIIVGVIVVGQTKKDSASSQSSSLSNNASEATIQTNQTYKDGSYSVIGTYVSPAGIEKIGVILTLAGNVVTGSSVTSGANDPTASSYQSLFKSGYKGYVDGKKITDINLTNVSGSSLTPKGFMDALKEIENNAKA